jgi:hypothetical protein
MSSWALEWNNSSSIRWGMVLSGLAFAASFSCSSPTLSAFKSVGVGSDFRELRNPNLHMFKTLQCRKVG